MSHRSSPQTIQTHDQPTIHLPVRLGRSDASLSRDETSQGINGISFVIPAFNEETSIGRVVEEAIQELCRLCDEYEVIVVDDASSDRTAGVAHSAGAKVCVHPYNRGYGNSLKSGISAAQHEHVVICDADGSYPVAQLSRIVQDAERYDMVVGARTGKRFYGSLPKRIGRWCQLSLVNYVTGTKVPDANSGFRLIRRSLALRYFDFVCTGFSFTTSITIALICEQYSVKFVDIDYARRQGSSHVRYFRDTLRSLQIITHCILRYNPLKAFLLLSAIPLACSPVPLISGAGTVAGVAGATACVCTSVLVFAMGMLAYCVGSSRSAGQPVDSGVYSWVQHTSAPGIEAINSKPVSAASANKAA